MTTEDDFQLALDAHPEDWQTRLVFADWLDERSDSRAEGYRAMGQLELAPDLYGWYPNLKGHVGYPNRCYWGRQVNSNYSRWLKENAYTERCCLTDPWFDALEIVGGAEAIDEWWVYYAHRRKAENAAALAFAELPATHKAQLLVASCS